MDPAREMLSRNRLQMLDEDELARLLATPTPRERQARRQFRQSRPRPKAPSVQVEATPQPIIPQKRQKAIEESEWLKRVRASPEDSVFSFSSPSVIAATPISSNASTPNAGNIKAIIQDAISPLMLEIKKLQQEVKQLQLSPNVSNRGANSTRAKEIQAQKVTEAERPAQAEKTKPIAVPQATKKLTYANIAAGEQNQTAEKTARPWTVIQKKKATSAADLTPRKATEPSQRRIIF